MVTLIDAPNLSLVLQCPSATGRNPFDRPKILVAEETGFGKSTNVLGAFFFSPHSVQVRLPIKSRFVPKGARSPVFYRPGPEAFTALSSASLRGVRNGNFSRGLARNGNNHPGAAGHCVRAARCGRGLGAGRVG